MIAPCPACGNAAHCTRSAYPWSGSVMDFSPVRIGLMKNTAVLVKKVTKQTYFHVKHLSLLKAKHLSVKDPIKQNTR